MDVKIAVDTLVVVVAVAVLTPLLLGLLPSLEVPQVVLLLLGGILIGPHVFALGNAGSVQFLADVGLGFVGAVGELFPVLAIALFLGVENRFVALASLLAVAAVAGCSG